MSFTEMISVLMMFVLNIFEAFWLTVSGRLIQWLPIPMLRFMGWTSPIQEMRPEILTEIFKRMELKDMAVFRRSSRFALQVIETTSVRMNNRTIHLLFNTRNFRIQWEHNSGRRGTFNYFQQQDGVLMRYEGVEMSETEGLITRTTEKFLRHEIMLDYALPHLKMLFQQQGAALERLLVEQNHLEGGIFDVNGAQDALAFLEKLGQFLKDRNWKLRVDNLQFVVLDQSHVMSVLPNLDRRTKNFDIIFTPRGNNIIPVHEINEIVMTEHWRNMESLGIQGIVDTQLAHFHQITFAGIEIASITLSDLIQMKERFCENPARMKYFTIIYHHFDNQGDPELAQLGDLEIRDDDQRRWRAETVMPQFHLRMTHSQNTVIFWTRRNL